MTHILYERGPIKKKSIYGSTMLSELELLVESNLNFTNLIRGHLSGFISHINIQFKTHCFVYEIIEQEMYIYT